MELFSGSQDFQENYVKIFFTKQSGRLLMDLRPFIKNNNQIARGIELIKDGSLFYQPFIIDENLEVGEGQNFADRYKDVNHIHDLNVYANGFDVGHRKLAPDKNYFRQCNTEYRQWYEFITDSILRLTSEKIENMTVGEIGCNTGLTLFNFAKRGARVCAGFDWNEMTPVFSWLNDILNTKVQFVKGTWNNLYHQFTAGNIPEFDIMINTIFTNHQCDPLQFITYICDRAKKGVFLWALVSELDVPAVEYPPKPPHEILDTQRPFPIYFNNDVRISKPLLDITFERLGFGKVTEIKPDVTNPKWDYFMKGFRMFYAQRTQDIKSAYWQAENTK